MARKKKTSNKKFLCLIIAVIVAILASLFLFRQAVADMYSKWQRGPVPKAVTHEQFVKQTSSTTSPKAPAPPDATTPTKKPVSPPPVPAETDSTLPKEINLAVPFVLQAPYAIWDLNHEDACEEASAIMMQGFAKGDKAYSTAEMEQMILSAIDFEEKVLGFSKDTDTAQTARIITEHFGVSGVKILPLTSIKNIKEQLAAGRPVMVPAYGRALKNPYFRQGGPLYHMLVIKGYTPGKFITHDPGTKRGADFVYDEKLLWNAIHDWNGGDVPNGPKVMVIIE